MINENDLLIYKNGDLFTLNLKTLERIYHCRFPFSFKHDILGRTRISTRLLRTDIRYGIKAGDEEYILIRDKKFYWFNKGANTIEYGSDIKRGRRILNIVSIENIENCQDGIYFGEYFGNPQKNEVSIIKLENNCKTQKIMYTFPKGKINHIHNLVPDHDNNCVWILTGDFENAAGIWMAKNGFNDVKPILVGKQNYRACVAFPFKKGLLYATDSPFERNSLNYLYQDGNTWETKRIHELNGPVIYGSSDLNDNFYLSTSVESNGNTKSKFEMLTSRKLGDGLKDDFSYLYFCDKECNEIKIVHKQKKDRLPFIPFRFGALVFPSGKINPNYIPIYNVATKKDDMRTKFISLSN
jgi:hypothetical protein